MRGNASRRTGAPAMIIAVLLAAAFAVAGCGSDSDNESSASTDGGNTKGEGIRAGTGDRAAKAKSAGEQAAKDAGGPTQMERKTVGIINFLDGIESSDRLKATSALGAKDLGWKVLHCDGKGTPSQFVACGNQLLDRGVDGIIEIAIEPGQIQPVLDKANAKKIPVIQVGGGSVPNGDLAGNYGPDETRAGQLLSDEIFKRLGSAGGDVAIQDFPAAWGATRTDVFRKEVEGQDAVKITADYQTDAANLVPFTQKAVTDNLTKNPDLKAYWFTFDTTGQVGGGVIQAKNAGKKFPDRPLVATFHADLGTIELMRKGAIDTTSEVNYDAGAWIGVDQMAEFFARGTEPSKENQPHYPVVGDLFTYKILDDSSLPPKGEYSPPEWDVPTFFQSKWAAEFNTGA
jgi:ABC-type sugar transport system substrate-binding protein